MFILTKRRGRDYQIVVLIIENLKIENSLKIKNCKLKICSISASLIRVL